jgi:hypothetical protein
MVRPLPSRRPVGCRRDGRPVFPICGASSEDESNEHLDDAEEAGQPQQVTVTQEHLGRLLTREKAQGERAAVKRLLAVWVPNNHPARKRHSEVVSDAPEQALGASMHIMRERLRETGDIREVLPATAHGWSWVPPLAQAHRG